jgi:hypothetical protein
VVEGTNYVSAVADSKTITITQADALVVTVNAITGVSYTGSPAAVSPSVTVTGLKFSDAVDSVTYTYASTSGTCAQGGTCTLGDTGPGGGKIFYVAPSPEWWGQYLEAAPVNLTSNSWCASGFGASSAFIGTSSAIGDGKLNSVITATNCAGGALGDARSYAGGGLIDWYLPSSLELAQIYAQRSTIGLDTSATYWSSNPAETTLAVAYNMSSGTTLNDARAMSYSIRPIRAFGPTSNSYSASTTKPTNAGAYSVTPSALALATGRSTSNYAGITYVAGSMVINKAVQTPISIWSQNGARTGVDETYTLYPTGGSSTGSNAYRVISGGTAGGCAATTHLSASVFGTCWVTVYRPGDNNYQAVIGSSIEVGFLKFETRTSGTVQIIDTATSPVINSISRTTGLAGDTVTITGGALTGTLLMVVGNVRVSVFTVVNSTRIDFRVPAGSLNGKIGVRNSKGEIAYSAQTFTTLAAPTLTITDSTLVGRVNVSFTDQLAFDTGSSTVDSFTLSLNPLPLGLSFNTTNAQFSGTPAVTQDTIVVTLRAHNRAGTASANFTLFIDTVVQFSHTSFGLRSMRFVETTTAETTTAETTTAETTTAETTTAETSTAETTTAETTTALAPTNSRATNSSDTPTSDSSTSSTPAQETVSSDTSTPVTETSSPSATVSETSTSGTPAQESTTTTSTTPSSETVVVNSASTETTSSSAPPTAPSETPSESTTTSAPNTSVESPSSNSDTAESAEGGSSAPTPTTESSTGGSADEENSPPTESMNASPEQTSVSTDSPANSEDD